MPENDKPAAAAPSETGSMKAGDHLGTINGQPVKLAADGKSADVPKPSDEPAATLEEWHAGFVARAEVTLVKPKRIVRGRTFPEQRNKVSLPTARAAVAMRTLHSMSPRELEQLKAAFAAAGVKSDHADAFEMWAMQHIESTLGAEVTGFAIQKTLKEHGHAAAIAKHRKAALSALAPAVAG